MRFLVRNKVLFKNKCLLLGHYYQADNAPNKIYDSKQIQREPELKAPLEKVQRIQKPRVYFQFWNFKIFIICAVNCKYYQIE